MEEEFKEKKEFNFKKYLPFIGIAVAVILVIVILALTLGGGPKRAVKKFVKAFNNGNASKLVDCIDFAGVEAWKYTYMDDFDKDDYKDFKDDYKDVDKDDIKDTKKEAKDEFKDGFEEIKEDYKSYKMKIEKIKDVEKLGKDLYKVKAKISLEAKPKDKDDDEIDESETMTFIVYKGKVIYSDMFYSML